MSNPALTFKVQPCDLFFARSSSFLSKAIRICEKGWGESDSEASHVGGFVGDGPRYWDGAYCVEALSKVEKHPFGETYASTGTTIMIARPLNLSDAQRANIVARAETMVGEKYGYTKIAAHLLDAALFGANFFRRFTFVKNRPICSWVWAYAFLAENLNFGCDYRVAQPDDMSDFIRANPDKYEIIREYEAME